MPQQPKIQVYVSYSRDEETKKKTIIKMQNTLQDIDFLIDTEQVKYRDNFMDFINKIGQAKYVVVVFSEDYLKSFYCMYELTKIMQAKNVGDIKQRVFPIRDENYHLNEENNKDNIIKYWQQVIDADTPRPENLTQQGLKKEVKEIQNQLDNIFNQFSTTLAPTAEELAPTFNSLFDNSYQAIRTWLKEVLPERVLPGKQKDSDQMFVLEVEQEITTTLVQFSILYEKISLKFNDINNEVDLAKAMCGYTNKQHLIAPLLIKACKNAVVLAKQSQSSKKVNELKEGIRRVLNCLCVLSIDSEWVSEQGNDVSKVIKLPVNTTFGQVSTAGRIAQIIPLLIVEGHNIIQGKHEITPFKQGAWSDANNLVVNAVLRFIYNDVFDTPAKGIYKDGDEITEEQREYLNNEIKVSAEAGSRHFYCMLTPNDIEPCFLKDSTVIQKLKLLLPALDIFEVTDTLGNTVFLVADEQALSQAYHHFLRELEQW